MLYARSGRINYRKENRCQYWEVLKGGHFVAAEESKVIYLFSVLYFLYQDCSHIPTFSYFGMLSRHCALPSTSRISPTSILIQIRGTLCFHQWFYSHLFMSQLSKQEGFNKIVQLPVRISFFILLKVIFGPVFFEVYKSICLTYKSVDVRHLSVF